MGKKGGKLPFLDRLREVARKRVKQRLKAAFRRQPRPAKVKQQNEEE